MTRIFYDTEFLEDGRTIELISIGMVRESDGAEYYAVSEEAAKRPLRRRIKKHDWLMTNVVPSLPKWHGDANLYAPKRWLFNYSDPCVKRRARITLEVRNFILGVPKPELWADYCAYDHVALCQLFGRMIDLPTGVPMYTNDFQQLVTRAGNPYLPSLPGIRQHNALDDARELKLRFDWLARLEAQKKVTDGQG